MVRVEQLLLENIGPFKKEMFDFSIEKENPDIHIFTGTNGSGKTTILHALASEFDYFEKDHKEHLSNLFYKRFHYFDSGKQGFPRSFAHANLKNKKTNKITDHSMVYGCKICGNIHQAYSPPKSNSNKIDTTTFQKKPHSELLNNYKNAIVAKNLNNKTFRFAAFGYSGYRLINSSVIQFDTTKDFNPLNLALEFVKDKQTGFLVSNWIVSRYSKAAIERNRGNSDLANRYMDGVNCLIQGLSELTNNEFSFEVQTSPWKVFIKHHDKEIEFDVLPDGLRSLLSWMGDLLMRLDEIPWENKNIPINEQDIILLLDEIEVHLHPKWQYYVLPLTRKLFPNAQIFLSTHSPFILNSIDNAKIYSLKTEKGYSKLDKISLSNTGNSYVNIYENILETVHQFGHEAIVKLNTFNELERKIIKKDYSQEADFIQIIQELKDEGEEVFDIIASKLFRLKRITGKDYLNG